MGDKQQEKKSILQVSPMAFSRIQALMARRSSPGLGVRVRLKTQGCSGLSYVLEYVDHPQPEDEKVFLSEDLTLFIQSKAVMFLIGTEMDYQETPTRSGFVFRNPNEKGRCGCGTSFHV